MTDSGPPPITGRAFLDREIVNALSRGTPREVSAIAGYLSGQNEDLTAELMPLLASAIGDDRQRWAEVAAKLVAGHGIPRPAVADVLAGKVDPKDWHQHPSQFVT